MSGNITVNIAPPPKITEIHPTSIFRKNKCIQMYKTGHKCKYSEKMNIFKPDGKINGLASCAGATMLHMENEVQSYVL